eukprot:6341944-Prymnesium_polylepis.1
MPRRASAAAVPLPPRAAHWSRQPALCASSTRVHPPERLRAGLQVTRRCAQHRIPRGRARRPAHV